MTGNSLLVWYHYICACLSEVVSSDWTFKIKYLYSTPLYTVHPGSNAPSVSLCHYECFSAVREYPQCLKNKKQCMKKLSSNIMWHFFTELIQQPYCVSPQSVCCLCVNDSSSEGGAGPPAIRVDCLLSPYCMMKCPWVRRWYPNCSRWAGHGLAWQLLRHCVWL